MLYISFNTNFYLRVTMLIRMFVYVISNKKKRLENPAQDILD